MEEAAIMPSTEIGTEAAVHEVCVPKMSSTSCDLRVFAEDAAETIMVPDLKLIYVCVLGEGAGAENLIHACDLQVAGAENPVHVL
jgi:hypothetical protein